MPIILGLIAALAAVYFFVMRAKNAADMAGELFDVASDVRLAARRFGFTRKTNIHPVESIEDARVAIASIASAFLELDSLPTAEQRSNFLIQLQSTFDINKDDAEELSVLGRWLYMQCNTPNAAITRLTNRLYKIEGTQAFEPLLALIKGTLTETDTTLNDQQLSALDDVRRGLKL